MTRILATLLSLTVAAAVFVAAQAAEPVDTAAVAAIRAEGLERSQVMDTLFWLTDRYGPRLTGSPEFEEAGDWAMERLESWGVINVARERFDVGPGWSLVRFHATMTEPRVMPIIGLPKAWSPGTGGVVEAEVVRAAISNRADAERYRGQLAGKIVLTQSARIVRMLEHGDGTVLRYTDQDGRWRDEALSPGPPDSSGLVGFRRPGGSRFDVMSFYRDEGVVALFDRGLSGDLSPGGSDLSWQQQRLDGGTVVLQERSEAFSNPAGLPEVTLAVEHYNRMVRLLDHGVPVRVELRVETAVADATEPRGFNIVGEIPGTDKADEVVLIGAHFDSWHGATGATDNAAGSAAVMEAMRIIRATGLEPRRTIRVALWGSEEIGDWNGLEAGLVGSRTYALEHFGTRDNPTPALAKVAAYFNLDNGTGPIRGVWMQDNAAVRPVFEAWSAPLRDLGVEILSPRRVQSTDHVPFDALGIPAFQFVQERYEYNARTHHTNMDVYDRIQDDDMMQMATVTAVFAWLAAVRDEPLPRNDARAR